MVTKKQRRPGEHTSPILQAIPAACADEVRAVELIEKMRWGKEACCPRCGDLDVTQMKDAEGNRNARFLWCCQGCKKQFTVRIGSIFEDSRIPLRVWVHAFWRSCSSKKGVSALQISRETGVSYKSALFLMHRIRHAMGVDPATPPQLSGTVEVDETYVGGKPRYKQKKRGRAKNWSKPTVFAMVERGGNVRAWHVTEVNAANLRGHIQRWVAPGSRVITDESPFYNRVKDHHEHETVNHRSREYVRKGTDVTTTPSRASSRSSSEGSTAPTTPSRRSTSTTTSPSLSSRTTRDIWMMVSELSKRSAPRRVGDFGDEPISA